MPEASHESVGSAGGAESGGAEHGEYAEYGEEIEYVDVLIVGAGLSGIGAACHLRREARGKSFAILESRRSIGGTWDLFRYPGIRSDSDMYTLSYSFRPWTDNRAIVDGTSIRAYIQDTARAYGVDRAIRYGHRVVRADWSSERAHWRVTVARETEGGATEEVRIDCGFFFCCSGYYRYDEGYAPDFPGIENFRGRVVHPQDWPEDLDHAGRRIVVIGSGATAVTLVPALAETAEHVTMLQRSPSYVVPLPSREPLARPLHRLLPERAAGSTLRWRNALLQIATYQLSRRAPRAVRKGLRAAVRSQLPSGYDVDTHFRPSYDPWDQRLCVVPDGDLFRALRSRRADVVTDAIEGFTENGIRLASGAELAADVVVTATGLNLLAFGGLEMTVDGKPVEPRDTVAYKGMMLSGVPNFAFTLGYTNASWTLKADLVARYVCRLLRHMDRRGHRVCTPRAPRSARGLRPLIDLKSGYVQRGLDRLPKQGPTAPWRLYQNYARDVLLLRRGRVDDGGMRFGMIDRKKVDRTP
ncbi:flavin-containing monooxygenase [Streptomyces sp. NPDC002851]